MYLVDTSVWIDHLRKGDSPLAQQLEAARVLGHPFVTGELSLGHLTRRDEVLDALRCLPQCVVASDGEMAGFIDRYRLFGLGIGYIDAHLLAAVHLTPGAQLWTRDRRLREVAERMGVAPELGQC